MWRVLASCPLRVKRACQVEKIKGDPVRLMRGRGRLDQARKLGDQPHQLDLGRVGQTLERNPGEETSPARRVCPGRSGTASAALRKTDCARACPYCT